MLRTEYSASWDHIINLITKSTHDKVESLFMRYVFQTTLYHLWREMNRRRHGEDPTEAASICKRVEKNVRNMIVTIQRVRDGDYEEALLRWFSYDH